MTYLVEVVDTVSGDTGLIEIDALSPTEAHFKAFWQHSLVCGVSLARDAEVLPKPRSHELTGGRSGAAVNLSQAA